MIRAIFFDLNGVLITSEHLSKRFEDAYSVPNATFVAALKEIMAVVRKPNAPKIFSLWEPYFKKWGIAITESQFLDFWFSGESVNEHALVYVKELKERGIDVFVLSNNFKERTTFYRSRFPQIFENLRGAFFSWETGYVKPSKEALLHILNTYTLEPQEVLYFDDSNENITLASELGIKAKLWTDLESAKQYLK